MTTFASLIQRDTRANQPAATAVPEGTLYYVTDENVTERSSGSAWEDVSDAGSGGGSPGGGGSGVVVQVVNTQTGALATGSGAMELDDTIPQNTEGDEYMTLAITPTSATNTLKIEVVAFLSANAVVWVIAALFQDATANALAAMMELLDSSGDSASIKFTHYMTAGTTSATTFKLRAGRASYAGTTTTFNGSAGSRYLGGVMASSITITEIVP